MQGLHVLHMRILRQTACLQVQENGYIGQRGNGYSEKRLCMQVVSTERERMMERYINADQMIADTEAMRVVSEAITIDGIVKYLNEHATTDVQEVKHGKDIYYTVCDKHCEFKCSVCNTWIGVVEGGMLDAARDFNYCPACGAKMDRKVNEE